jgi:predicted PolB exonuclease-like 3'-5' exonuclease
VTLVAERTTARTGCQVGEKLTEIKAFGAGGSVLCENIRRRRGALFRASIGLSSAPGRLAIRLTEGGPERMLASAMTASFLVLDIETVLDPELPISPAGDVERLPSPPHHKIVVLGALLFDPSYQVKRIAVIAEGKDEAGMLFDFAKLLEERRPCLITFNGRGFDLPVIATRCLRYGVTFRHYYNSRDVRYRFTADGHLDLMDYIADFGATKSTKLDVIAKLCGMPGKVGVDGKDVGPMVHAGRLQEVRDYCLCDVAQTAGVFLRLQLVRGELDRERYLVAMAGLIRAIRENPKLEPVAAALNEERLMLREAGSAPAPAQLPLPAVVAPPVLAEEGRAHE